MKCPECGQDDEYDSEECPECHHTWHYEEIVTDDRSDSAFTWIFECKNCGWVFPKEFKRGETVRIKAPSPYRAAEKDPANGNAIIAIVEGKRCLIQCECCGIDTMLVKVDAKHDCIA